MCAKILNDTTLFSSAIQKQLTTESEYDQIFKLYEGEKFEDIIKFTDFVNKKREYSKIPFD